MKKKKENNGHVLWGREGEGETEGETVRRREGLEQMSQPGLSVGD